MVDWQLSMVFHYFWCQLNDDLGLSCLRFCTVKVQPEPLVVQSTDRSCSSRCDKTNRVLAVCGTRFLSAAFAAQVVSLNLEELKVNSFQGKLTINCAKVCFAPLHTLSARYATNAQISLQEGTAGRIHAARSSRIAFSIQYCWDVRLLFWMHYSSIF